MTSTDLIIQQYFGSRADWPVIEQEFHPDQGWVSRPRWRKKVTQSWLRKLRREGVTLVALRSGARSADFGVSELLAERKDTR